MVDKEYIRFMMDNIKVGDTLICINDKGAKGFLTLDGEYTIDTIFRHNCAINVKTDMGVTDCFGIHRFMLDPIQSRNLVIDKILL